MDKQALKKHHFWILLGLAIVLIPIALSGAVFGVGGAAEEKSKKIDDKLKALKGQQPKSDDYREQLAKQKLELQTQKDRVWREAYQAQDGLIRWPQELDRLNDMADKGQLYFGDPISDRDRADFRKPDVYLAEYKRLPNVIAPTEFGEGGWQKVLEGRFVPDFTSLPSVEDVWLALEDLCVQREVLRDIQHVNQMLAEFLPVPQPIKEPTPAKGKGAEELKRFQEDQAKYLKDKDAYNESKKKIDEELATQFKVQKGEFAGRFISPYWQLDIVVGRPVQGRAGELNFRGRLTNNSHRRQNIAEIDFKVWLNSGPKAGYVLLPIQEEYLAADKSVDFNRTIAATGEPALKVYKVEQKLNGKNVPVKQVVKLDLGYPSHRFANINSVASAFSKKEIDAAPPPVAATPGAPPPPGAGGGGDTTLTQNGIPRFRYLERTDQTRRMAVAIVMIVDQAHVQDVIRALSNSRLRFQNTQIHYERFRGMIALDGTGAAEPPPVAAGPGGRPLPPRMAALIGGKSGGRNTGPGRGEERGGRRPGGPQPGMPIDPNATVEEENNNLVELTVYGLISLYERYPPRTTTDQASAPGTAPAPTAPNAPPPPPPPPNAPIPPAGSPGGNLPAPAAPTPNPTATPPTPPKPS